MGKLLLILVFLSPVMCIAQSQPFFIDDLVNLSSLSPQGFDDYIVKKNFSVKEGS